MPGAVPWSSEGLLSHLCMGKPQEGGVDTRKGVWSNEGYSGVTENGTSHCKIFLQNRSSMAHLMSSQVSPPLVESWQARALSSSQPCSRRDQEGHIHTYAGLEVRLPDARTQSDRRRLGSVTLARSKVRVRAGYEFVSCRHHPRSKAYRSADL